MNNLWYILTMVTLWVYDIVSFGDLRFDIILACILDWYHDDMVINVLFGYVWLLVGYTSCAMM